MFQASILKPPSLSSPTQITTHSWQFHFLSVLKSDSLSPSPPMAPYFNRLPPLLEYRNTFLPNWSLWLLSWPSESFSTLLLVCSFYPHMITPPCNSIPFNGKPSVNAQGIACPSPPDSVHLSSPVPCQPQLLPFNPTGCQPGTPLTETK